MKLLERLPYNRGDLGTLLYFVALVFPFGATRGGMSTFLMFPLEIALIVWVVRESKMDYGKRGAWRSDKLKHAVPLMLLAFALWVGALQCADKVGGRTLLMTVLVAASPFIADGILRIIFYRNFYNATHGEVSTRVVQV